MNGKTCLRFLNSHSDNRKSKIQKRPRRRKWVGIFVFAFTFAFVGVVAQAQQPTKVPRIGFLTLNSSSTFSAGDEAFRQGLISVGYIEGKNIVIEWRYAEGNVDRLREMAAELLRLKVNVIVTGGPSTTRLVKQATSALPIIMATDPDPVGNGFVASLARPGGNITGLSSLSPEISGKQLELLKDVVPRLSRLAVFGNTTSPGNAQRLKEVKLAAGAFKVQLQYLNVQVSKDVELAFRAASKGRAEAVLQLSSSVFNSRRAEISQLAVKNRFPAIYPWPEFVEAGGLMSYGISLTDLHHRAAIYVDKILKGANPADLPVEQPTKFEFIINLKAAAQIGLTIPANVLARADRVIR